jgi:hypothetical protein
MDKVQILFPYRMDKVQHAGKGFDVSTFGNEMDKVNM